MINFEQWEGFEGRIWKEEVNVRDPSSVRGTGFDPGPTNPVTPRVLRTTYQVSSFITILRST